MPKVTSLSARNSNKENIGPSNRVKKASAATARYSDDEDVQMSQAKRTKSSSSLRRGEHEKEPRINGSRHVNGDGIEHASSSHDSNPIKARKSDLESHREEDRRGRRERMLEERIALLTKEKDQVQSQFDELRELRQSEPERALAEWRKASDRRDAQAEEYVNKLKGQVKILEQSQKRDAMSSSSDGAFLRATGREEAEAEEWSSKEKKLKEEVTKLKQELAAANLAARSGRAQPSTISTASTIGTGDEKAIRRLYEDLTGLFISKVEPAVKREKEHYRCFHATFASEGYYNLEMKLEESESNLPSTDLHPDRQDLVYVPSMNPDRDAEIIASGKLPSYLTESLRFERSTAVRFMSTLHKRLDKSSKR